MQFGFVANDVFVIIALPNVAHRRVLAHPFGHADFESPDDGTDGFRCAMGYVRTGNRPGIGVVVRPDGIVVNDHDNSMDMVRHHNEFVQCCVWEMIGDGAPTLRCNPTCLVQCHFTIRDITEQTRAVVRANGEEIRPGLGIIISTQADGSAVVVWLMMIHGA